MAVGLQASETGLNGQLTSLAVNMRNDMRNIANFQEYVVALGTAGLEALGFSSGDAATFMTMASYMNTIAGVYLGTATQGSTFDFDNALCGLWAGQ